MPRGDLPLKDRLDRFETMQAQILGEISNLRSDVQSFKAQSDERHKGHDKRLNEVEDRQKWAGRFILGQLVAGIVLLLTWIFKH